MIFNFTNTTRFYLYQSPVDMRKGIHSLYQLVCSTSKLEVLGGDSFIFIGRNRKSVKILRWHNEGFVLYYKKLELGQYRLPLQVGHESFTRIDGQLVDKLATEIKHNRISNELRRKALSSL